MPETAHPLSPTEIAGFWFFSHGEYGAQAVTDDDGRVKVRGWFQREDGSLDHGFRARQEAQRLGFYADHYYDDGCLSLVVWADKVPLTALPEKYR